MDDSILAHATAQKDRIITLLRLMVECESPSGDGNAIDRFVALMCDVLAPIARIQTYPGGHLRAEFSLPGKKAGGQILVLGHSDTVWPLGTLQTMPFRQAKGRLWGPGVLDMKSGLAFFVFAMRVLRDLEIPVARKVVLQVNADEEVGSQSSRALTEQAARKSQAVLVLEPGQGLGGMLKTSRKGVGMYRLSVHGKAAHAGVDPQNGVSAVVELARQIGKISGFGDARKGITVNTGVISGGTRSNVVAAEASAEIDVRIARAKDAAALERKFRGLKPLDRRCSISLEGGVNRPPMERTPGVVSLFKTAKKLAAEMSVKLEESGTGGGSDGNFTAALGVPTLDGLGGVGEGAHAVNESILVDRIADRTALLAKLVAVL